eukprot:gene12771-biopygen2750
MGQRRALLHSFREIPGLLRPQITFVRGDVYQDLASEECNCFVHWYAPSSDRRSVTDPVPTVRRRRSMVDLRSGSGLAEAVRDAGMQLGRSRSEVVSFLVKAHPLRWRKGAQLGMGFRFNAANGLRRPIRGILGSLEMGLL